MPFAVSLDARSEACAVADGANSTASLLPAGVSCAARERVTGAISCSSSSPAVSSGGEKRNAERRIDKGKVLHERKKDKRLLSKKSYDCTHRYLTGTCSHCTLAAALRLADLWMSECVNKRKGGRKLCFLKKRDASEKEVGESLCNTQVLDGMDGVRTRRLRSDLC